MGKMMMVMMMMMMMMMMMTEIYFKELAHTNCGGWRLESLKSMGQDSRLETREEVMLQPKSKSSLEAEFPLLQEPSIFLQ